MEYLDPKNFGAAGDGQADDTGAIQVAVDRAAKGGGTVFFSPGTYRTGELFLREGVCLKADAAWSYGSPGPTVLIPRDGGQACVVDLTGAYGATVDGLSVDGRNMGGDMCGLMLRKPDFGKREDAFRIENCRIAGFSGHAVYLNRAWCFSVRHSMFAFSRGDGLRLHGWDAFILDNWFSGNAGAGFATENGNASVTMTGNRIEWNARGGIIIEGGSQYNITGNYIDRSGGPAIALVPRREGDGVQYTHTISCSGNVIYRSGKSADGEKSCHILMEGCFGASVCANTMCLGRDDGWTGRYSPDFGMALSELCDCVVSNNTLFAGAAKELIRDKGGHSPGTVIRDNPGSLVPEGAMAPDASHPRSIPHMLAHSGEPWFKEFFSK